MTINYISTLPFLFLLITAVCTICGFFSPLYTQTMHSPKQAMLNELSYVVLTLSFLHVKKLKTSYFFHWLSPPLPIPICQACHPSQIKYSKCGHTTPDEVEMIVSSSPHNTSIHFRRGLPFFATTANCTFTSNFGWVLLSNFPFIIWLLCGQIRSFYFSPLNVPG